jgi:hypothetical protein
MKIEAQFKKEYKHLTIVTLDKLSIRKKAIYEK